MKRWKRNLSLALTVLFLFSALTGCGRKELDGMKMIDAYLKAETKGEYEDYAKLTGTDEEELKKMYDEVLDETLGIFEEVEFFDVDLGDDFKEELKNILATVKYEVIGSEKDEDDNYIVDVDVYPSDIFGFIFGEVFEAVKSSGGDMDKLGDSMIQAIQDAVGKQSYGEAVRCKIHITYDEDTKEYEINEDDVNDLVENFFDVDGAVEAAMEAVFSPSGTVYDDPYFNWTATEWKAASEEDKTQCCLAIVQEVYGLSDEDMAGIDVDNTEVQEAIQQIKDGIDTSYSMGIQISIGDYVEMIKEQF